MCHGLSTLDRQVVVHQFDNGMDGEVLKKYQIPVPKPSVHYTVSLHLVTFQHQCHVSDVKTKANHVGMKHEGTMPKQRGSGRVTGVFSVVSTLLSRI